MSTNKIKIGIVGATGYTGVELIRILLNHPQAQLDYLTSASYVGKNINEIYPHLQGFISKTLVDFNLEDKQLNELDVLFLALPHGHALTAVPELLKKGLKVIDLGADFRFANIADYEKAYQKHTAPETNKQAVYGLPELNRQKIASAELIANPGCYVTASTLALKPIVDNFKYVADSIIIDAKSGVSGAGRSLTQMTHFPDCNENFSAYKLDGHRHQPEIEQNLGARVVFAPHLLPNNRGILATCYIKLAQKTTLAELKAVFEKKYQNEKFVKLVAGLPGVKDVASSNMCYLGLVYKPEIDQVIVVSVIDNLVKGASGQAVQNMNIMFGIEESTGLTFVPVYP